VTPEQTFTPDQVREAGLRLAILAYIKSNAGCYESDIAKAFFGGEEPFKADTIARRHLNVLRASTCVRPNKDHLNRQRWYITVGGSDVLRRVDEMEAPQ